MFETKVFGGYVSDECKELSVEGVRVGVVKGYLATWQPDQGGRFGVPEQFFKGAFAEDLQDKRNNGNRPLKLKLMHDTVIGRFPLETVREDDIGLYGEGHINLETQLGRETYALVKQGALSDFSIGFKAIDDTITNDRLREIRKSKVREGSIVDEPMNVGAVITEIKGAQCFADLPLASADHSWDVEGALERIEELDGETKQAFLWVNPETSERRYPIADIVGETLMAIPAAITAAATELKRVSEGVPEDIRLRMVEHLGRYYAKMGQTSPFAEGSRFWGVEDVKLWTPRDFREALTATDMFSKSAVKALGGRFEAQLDGSLKTRDNPLQAMLDDMRSLSATLR